MDTVRVALVGLGNIGSGVFHILRSKAALLAKRSGVRIELAYACDMRKSVKKSLRIPDRVFSSDAGKALRDPRVDIVIELIGGTQAARSLQLEAFRRGKHVVTANKALLAEYAHQIFPAAAKARREIYFEASVGGGIPIIKSLREAFIANRITSIHSIINGTCNYILTKMSKEGFDFKTALGLAQKEGFAEADPTLDVNGSDAAHKIALLAMLAFGGLVPFKKVSREGITGISSGDIAFAKEFGYKIKLLAIAKKTEEGIEARVQPTLLPDTHILANIDYSFNAILLRGDEVGDSLLYGRGAGQRPTSSAIISDIVDLARTIRGGRKTLPLDIRKTLRVKNISAIESRYYIRLMAVDIPGVLSRIASVLGRHRVSISDVIQKESGVGRVVPLILLTHKTREETIRQVVTELRRLSAVRSKAQVIRIED